jgi:hypothetical protein
MTLSRRWAELANKPEGWVWFLPLPFPGRSQSPRPPVPNGDWSALSPLSQKLRFPVRTGVTAEAATGQAAQSPQDRISQRALLMAQTSGVRFGSSEKPRVSLTASERGIERSPAWGDGRRSWSGDRVSGRRST